MGDADFVRTPPLLIPQNVASNFYNITAKHKLTIKMIPLLFLNLFSIINSSSVIQDTIPQIQNNLENIKTISLKPIGMSSDTIFKYAYYDIKSYDSLLFVIDSKTGEALKVLDVNSLNLVSSIGVENGKMLFENPSNIQINSVKKNISISNQTTGKVILFDISDGEVNKTPTSIINLPSSSVTNAVVLNDSLCVYSDVPDDFILRIFNYKQDSIIGTIEIPFSDGFIYNSDQWVNAYFDWNLEYANSYIICFSRTINKIFLYNLQNHENKIIEGPKYENPFNSIPVFKKDTSFSLLQIPQNSCGGGQEPGFWDLSCTENYLFGLLKDPKSNTNLVIVFDYNGKHICMFDLQESLGSSLTVDEKARTIYLLQPPVGFDNVIFKYKFELP
jgi:hypothetical protein